MVWTIEDERFMVLWRRCLFMGWVVCRKQSIEETEESAFTHVTNVANFGRAKHTVRHWVP